MTKRTLTTALFAALALASQTHAASITKSTTAPTINGKDLANYGAQATTDKWWNDNAASGATKGQTFRTGNEAIRLNAITYKTTNATEPTKTFTIRVGKVSGTTFTQTYSETATQSVAWAANNYVTWVFTTPVLLLPNTLYGIDVAMVTSSSAWQTGIPYLSVTEDEFAGGSRFSSGTSGVGTTAMTDVTRDRVFHLDMEKPIGPGWNLVATTPADGAVNVSGTNVLAATFSQDIVRGTGNITLRNLTSSIDTVIPVTDPRISISENLLTITPTSALLANTNYAIRIDPTAIDSVLGVDFPGIINDTTWNFTTGAGDPLLLALSALKSHINGGPILTAAQISAHKVTIDTESGRLADNAILIAASLDLVTTYDNVLGPLFVSRSLPARASVTNDIHWTLYTVMQDIMDVTYNSQPLANFESLLNGFKFGSSASFPGPCSPPADPSLVHTAIITGSYLDTRGRSSQGDGSGSFARKPTGCYLAPGSIATVTVPAALVGKGYKIRVGAHSWDFSNKPSIKRLDRSSLVYNIDALATKIASPLGGGIYIEVPWNASAGVVNVQIKNAVRSPYFSAKTFHTTTAAQWLTERVNPAPWADFQSDKFMMQVPSSWINAMPDPTKLMQDWDASMDVINDLMGFPRIRGKETLYPQVDMQIRASVYAPGYPSVNVGGYSATATFNGYSSNYLVRGPQYSTNQAYIDFHEQGHGYFFPKFAGETESNVNLLYVPVLHQKFGLSLDAAFRASLGYSNTFQTLETTAVAWMTVFNFSPRKVEMADGEKAYQLKGHAKFVDIARLYGWGAMNKYGASMVNDEESGSTVSESTDSLILRLSKAVGRDVRPLLHFWGIYPDNQTTLAASMAAANLTVPSEIYDTLVRYKSLVPANNAAFRTFATSWWGGQPSINGNWEEREHARQWDTTALYSAGDQQRSQTTNPGEIYNENSASDITNRVQELINYYYPSGRPADTTPPAIFKLSPVEDAIGSSLTSNLVMTFTEPVAVGTGNITIKNLTDATQTTIAITDTTQVTVAGAVLTINPTASLIASRSYAIQIAATAIDDTTGNSFAGIANDTTWNFSSFPDTTVPTLTSTSIVDDRSGNPVAVNTLVNYTVTFSENMDATTVSTADFGNAGTSAVTIGTVTETIPGVFTVPVTPTSAGTLQLRVNAAAVLTDVAGNALVTTSAILDNTTLTVDGTVPTLAGTNIVDNKSGIPVTVNTLVTYTVTFSEDMDATTVSTADFGNAGTSVVTIGTVTETTPGVFTVPVTPTSAGTLQLRVNAAAVLRDVAGNSLVTTSAILDNTTIVVQTAYASWAVGTTFNTDANNDGVANGLAWLLGAINPSANATGLLPKPTSQGGKLMITFRCLKTTSRGTAVLKVQFTNNLGQPNLWSNQEAVVPDADGTVGSVFFDTTADADPAFINVRAEIPASAASSSGNLYARLLSTGN